MVIGVGIAQVYSIRRAGSATRDQIAVECYELRDRYSAARHALERWLVRRFIHVAMDLYLRRFAVEAHSRWNMARWWVYMPSGMRRWRQYIPGGFATDITYDPDAAIMPDGVRIDPITRRFFRHSLDATGLRSRAYLLMEAASRLLEHDTMPLRWVSLGGGTGIGPHQYLTSLSPQDRYRISLVIADRDADALAFGRLLARREPRVKRDFVEMDVTQARDLRRVLAGKPRLIDAMGLIEYLDDATATVLAKRVYTSLSKGGVFVFSNMADDRPELNVHQRAVGWPGVIVRSPRQILRILSDAGIPDTAVRIMCADDGVYYVCEVTKA